MRPWTQCLYFPIVVFQGKHVSVEIEIFTVSEMKTKHSSLLKL